MGPPNGSGSMTEVVGQVTKVGVKPISGPALSASQGIPFSVVLITNVSRGIVGGIAEYLGNLICGLQARDIHVEAIMFPKILNIMEARGMPRILRIPIHGLFGALALVRALRKWKVLPGLLVHTHGASYVLAVAFLAKWFGLPAVHTFHSAGSSRSRFFGIFTPKLNAVVFVSRELQEALAISGVRNLWVRYIPGGVDTSMYVPVDPTQRDSTRRAILASHGRSDRGHLVAFVGRIVREKGVLELVRAAQYLRDKGCPVSFLIAGSAVENISGASYAEEVRNAVSDSGLGEWVSLVGPIGNVAKTDLLSAADIFVCPSYWEGSPMSVMEAFACGTPVVATRVGGLPDLVDSGETGLLVTPRDTLELARAIQTLVDAPDLRKRMANEARRRAVASWSQAVMTDRHIDLYLEILRKSTDHSD